MAGQSRNSNQDDEHGIGLFAALDMLRRELAEAQREAKSAGVTFPVESVTVELQVGLTRGKDGKVGFKVPFLGAEVGGSGSIARETVQTVTLVLGTPQDRDGEPIKVADEDEDWKN
ncbi:trypco2 family protein [Streptomyces sp. NPDC046727]|uniref:trypco2 family protein n=1 Tax=Streptomyces sp. NPDC046727 TaxID=3155373 RepID=UPI0033CDA325